MNISGYRRPYDGLFAMQGLSRPLTSEKSASADAAQEVGVHHPALTLARVASHAHDLVGHLAQGAGHEDLVGHANVRTPMNLHVLIDEARERAVGVEHHHHFVHPLGEALREAAPGRDLDWAPD